MRKQLSQILSLAILLLTGGCLIKEDPKATYSDLLVSRGDIVVTSLTSDSLVVFDDNGVFKKVLYQLANPVGDAIGGIAWLPETNEILIAIDGTPDRVEAFSVLTGTIRNFYLNTTYFTGTVLALAQLKNSSDVIVSEGTSIERFSNKGIRETWGAIWPSTVHLNSQQLIGASSGRWLSCSSTAGLRLSPDSTSNLTAVATATSLIAATTASFGCAELSDGRFVVGWNGTNDTIQTYSATLTSPTTIFPPNIAVLPDPRGIAVGENDELYVVDGTRNVVVEIDPTNGDVVREFGNSYLQAPRTILVIPAINL